MATAIKPQIFRTAFEGWRLAFQSFSRMPLVFGIAMVLLFIVNIVTLPITPAPSESTSVSAHLVGFFVSISLGFLLTPVAIAVHRYVLLGEVNASYVPNPSDPRFIRFFLFTVIYGLLTSVPALLNSIAVVSGSLGGSVLAIVMVIAGLIVCMRLVIMFPAIAVDARAVEWRNAYWDSKGNTWRIFWIIVLTMIPTLLVLVPAFLLLAWPNEPSLASGIVLSAVQAIAFVVVVAAVAAVASQLYTALGIRLRGAVTLA